MDLVSLILGTEEKRERKRYGEVSPFNVTNGRRQPRYPWRLPIEVCGECGVGMYDTRDISLNGCYVVTEQPAPRNQLIQVVAYLPDSERIEFIARVVHVVRPEQASGGKPPGMGLEIFSMEKAQEPIWRAFMSRVAGEVSVMSVEEPPTQQADGTRPRREQEVHREPEARIPANPNDLVRLIRMLRSGKQTDLLYLDSKVPAQAGMYVAVELRHAGTGESLDLYGRVVRVRKQGTGVSLAKLSGAERRALIHFAVTGSTAEARKLGRAKRAKRPRRKAPSGPASGRRPVNGPGNRTS